MTPFLRGKNVPAVTYIQGFRELWKRKNSFEHRWFGKKEKAPVVCLYFHPTPLPLPLCVECRGVITHFPEGLYHHHHLPQPMCYGVMLHTPIPSALLPPPREKRELPGMNLSWQMPAFFPLPPPLFFPPHFLLPSLLLFLSRRESGLREGDSRVLFFS